MDGKLLVSPQLKGARIYGGTLVKRPLPYLIHIISMIPRYNRPPNYELCGGTLITKTHVLTARHCVYKAQPWNVKLTAGHLNKRNRNSKEQVFSICFITACWLLLVYQYNFH